MSLTFDTVNTTATDILQVGPGPYLTAPIVVPIFWGKAWDDASNPSPTWLEVFTGLQSIVSGPFMDSLSQYAGIQHASLRIQSGTRYDQSEPPNPFKDSDVQQLVANLAQAGLVGDPSEDSFLYAIFVPPGVTRTPPGLGGDHTAFQINGVTAYCLWVLHGDLDTITTIFSHELVEACSDPGGSGITMNQAEIADWCAPYTARLVGTQVQAYWSGTDRACVIPTVPLKSIGRWWPVGIQELSDAVFGVGGLAVVPNADGTLEVFGRRPTDGAIMHIRQNPPRNFGFTYDAWQLLGSETLPGTLCAIANTDGRIEVFAAQADGIVYHNWQTVSNAEPSRWAGWFPLGQLSGGVTPVTAIGCPYVARNANGSLEVFVCGTDNALWHIQQTPATDWGSDWHSLGGSILAGSGLVPPVLCVGTNQDGRLEAFIRTTDGSVLHNWQIQPNADPTGWAGWNTLGTAHAVTQLAVAREENGKLALFAIGTDAALWYITQTPALDWASAWNSLGGQVDGLITVGTNLDGSLEVFVRGPGLLSYRNKQNIPNAGPTDWSGYTSGDMGVNALAVASNSDGRLELFSVGNGSLLCHQWQMFPNGGWNW
jgi:hypothetical protein